MVSSIEKPHPDVVFTRFDETSAALLHLRSKRYYTLNETAARVWELLAAGSPRQDIVTSLVAEFEVEIDEARTCVRELLAELASEGLVVA